MIRQERQHEGDVLEGAGDRSVDVDPHRDTSTTKFSDAGTIPPVTGDGTTAAPATASERAYAPHSHFGFGGFGGLGGHKQPTSQLPLTKPGSIDALTARKDAEALLTSKGVDASSEAKKALDLLVNLPESQRGSVIDGLAPKAFENLLDRISDADRERFYTLVDVVMDPERKLKLWAEAHKARATNNVERHKGDIGAPVPMTEEEEEDGTVTQVIDDEAEEELRTKLSKDQLRNRKRHFRREDSATTTRDEVDDEVKALMAQAKNGHVSLKDVDALRERKELEYQIELESNVNLTAQTPNAKGDAAFWKKEDLVQVERTLPRLAQSHDPDGFDELRRVHSRGWGVGGQYHNSDNAIEITDWASGPTPGFRHGGDKRELVSDEFKNKNGDTIGTLEFVLTHEIGHDVDAKHERAYEEFQKAAGWERVKVDALRDDGVSDSDIVTLEKRRADPNSKSSDIKGRTKIYSPISNSKDEYWAVPITAIPAQNEAAPGSQSSDSWSYSRVNPDEHFAEVYAKAVHVPEKLHDELVVRPTEAAAKARDKYQQMKRLLDAAEADKSPNGQLKTANLRSVTGAFKSEMDRLETARDQRVAEFEAMRNSVFHTDKAVQLSVARLQFKQVSKDKIEKFKERAAAASTPEQVAYLENEASK